MKSPFFSIVLPTYNREDFLSHAINSVINQTYKKWELIIIDDGSTDNTKEIVLSFNDDRVRYIYQENKERSAARNNGINNAKGDYICFLDSDDKFEPNHLESINNQIIEDDYNHKVYFTLKKTKSENGEISLQSSDCNYKNTYVLLLSEMLHCQQVCIHKSIFNHLNFNNKLYVGEDIELWFRIAEKHSFNKINQHTVIINNHLHRTVSINNEKTYILMKNLMHILLKKYKEKIPQYDRENCLGGVHFNLAKHYFLKRKTIDFIKQIIISGFYNLKYYHIKDLAYTTYLYIKKESFI